METYVHSTAEHLVSSAVEYVKWIRMYNVIVQHQDSVSLDLWLPRQQCSCTLYIRRTPCQPIDHNRRCIEYVALLCDTKYRYLAVEPPNRAK